MGGIRCLSFGALFVAVSIGLCLSLSGKAFAYTVATMPVVHTDTQLVMGGGTQYGSHAPCDTDASPCWRQTQSQAQQRSSKGRLAPDERTMVYAHGGLLWMDKAPVCLVVGDPQSPIRVMCKRGGSGNGDDRTSTAAVPASAPSSLLPCVPRQPDDLIHAPETHL